MVSVWNKYKKIKEVTNKSKIKTYLVRIEPIIKEIVPKDEDNYSKIYNYLNENRNELKIFDIIEENKKIYVVIDNDNEANKRIDDLILQEEFNIKKESILIGHGNPIFKDEILNLFKMEESMCKIKFERMENNEIKKGIGSGFFCEIINDDFPIKYCLFTNNHVLNEKNLETNNIIHFEYYKDSKNIEKEIIINENRKVYTDKKLDYTCIEILNSDGIKKFFKIDPLLFKYDNIDFLKGNDIFILQYPNGDDLSFSDGKIIEIKDNCILHTASTEGGSSGSPIIRRTKDNYIIGLHFGGSKDKKSNIATKFNSILKEISKGNEINCIYFDKYYQKEIDLIHDYNDELKYWSNEDKKLYSEAKELNKKLFEENIDLYVNDKKVKFDFKLQLNDSKEVKVKFKFKTKLTNITYMFFKCICLKSIDLSSFNTTNVNNMRYMFFDCHCLELINLSSFNTTNDKDMSGMFSNCSSLKTIDLSSFNTINVNNMSNMFYYCSSLESIDLSSFNTNNVNNMSYIFSGCSNLKSIDLSLFNTINVKNMSDMFFDCSNLKSIDLSYFNTTNINNMSYMFYNCSSLNTIDLSSFNTINVNNMSYMFYKCSSLESINLSSFNTTNVENMSNMFSGCSNLKSIDLSLFNTINVKNMSDMFSDCSNVNSINLSSFKTTNVEDMSNMFSGCPNLKSIDLSYFNTTNVNDMRNIFFGCPNLKKKNIKIKNKKDNLLKEI